MGVLDGFFATWDGARQTFGEGTPQGGSQIDASAKLGQLGADLQSAAPGEAWTGDASDSYGAANTKHSQNLTTLAGLDRKLGAQMDAAADVVTTGRTNLDSVRQWVTDAAGTVPPGKQRDLMLMQIANKGLSQVSDIVQTSNDANNTIRDNVNNLKPEYEAISFGGEFKEEQVEEDLLDEGKPDEQKDSRERAEQDVQDLLAGDGDAARRVDDVLTGITPGNPLTPEQKSYLSQMQAQQHGMSVEELATAEQRLGDNRDVMANSWQLMSRDDVEFTRTELSPEKLDEPNSTVSGSFAQLPESVRDALGEAGQTGHRGGGEEAILLHSTELTQISEIIQHGDDNFQQATELDRAVLIAADDVLDQSESIREHSVSYVAESLFEAVAPDHRAIGEHILGDHGDDFLGDINRLNWSDDGRAAADLFSWTNEAHQGGEAALAAQTAEKYARYIEENHHDLSHIGNETLGERNPELVKGYAHGLVPFIPQIADLSISGTAEPFSAPFNDGDAELASAKAVYSVIATEKEAYLEFVKASDAHILARTVDWALSVDPGGPVDLKDLRLTDSATLHALEAMGTAQAAQSTNVNAQEMFDERTENYEDVVKALSGPGNMLGVAGPVAGWQIETIGQGMQNSIIGTGPVDIDTTVADMPHHDASRFMLNALLSAGRDVGELPIGWTKEVPVDIDGQMQGTKTEIKTLTELGELRVNPGLMEQEMQAAMNRFFGDPTGYLLADSISKTYDNIVKNPLAESSDAEGE